VNDGPVQFTLRRLQALVFLPRFWGVIVAVSVVLGIAGPFGTLTQLPLLPRFGYWLTLSLATFLAGYTTIGLMSEALQQTIEARPVRLAVAGLVAGVPVTAVVVVVNRLLFGDPIVADWGTGVLYLNCSLIAVAVSFVFGLVDHGAGADAEPAAPARPVLLDRLPAAARGRLLYLSMQDHYVDVHTDKGGTLVLLRLADAIREAGPVAGLQIHRSHWVALDAVAGTQRKDGKLLLKMRDGAALPVSRSALAAVRARGLA
jgi:hypothetical protein